MQPKDKVIVAVCTLDYANELSNQLITIPMKAMKSGEWRTISLHNHGSNITIESCCLMNNETIEKWKQSINNVIAIYCNIKDTPFDAMWTKAEREWSTWLCPKIIHIHQRIYQRHRNKVITDALSAMP